MLTFSQKIALRLHQIRMYTNEFVEYLKTALSISSVSREEIISYLSNRRIFNRANATTDRLTSFYDLVSHEKTYGHVGIVSQVYQSDNIVFILQEANQCSSENGDRDVWNGKSDLRWYRIAGNNYWVGSTAINGNAPRSTPSGSTFDKNTSNNMIFNERQYITTKARISEFGKAIAKLENNEESPDANQKLRQQVQLDALNSQLEELQEEITEYESLKTGDIKGVTINSFEEWPEVLIKARIARGWSQEQFANILEVHPQQIQRDESTRYAGSSLRKIIAIQKALGITVREEVTFN
jgi:ribosome-binding protein aMBF1 (putative translation factor)